MFFFNWIHKFQTKFVEHSKIWICKKIFMINFQIESEMVGVQRYVQDELTKVGRESPIVPRREVVAPPRAEPVHAQVLGSGNGSDGENQSTDNLTRLLQNAKVDIGQRLKRPTSASTQDRLPLEDIGSNRLQL